MNKFFIAAASALALASCSSDDFLGEIQGNEQNGATSAINFGGDTGKITRATTSGNAAAGLLENNFVVVGFKGSNEDAANNKTYAFDHYNVNFKDGSAFSTESNRAGWEYVNQDMKVKGTEPAASLAQSGATQQTIKYWDHSCASYDFIAFSMGKKDAASKYATPTHVDKANLKSAAYTLSGNVNTLSECYISDMKTVTEPNYDKTPVSMSFRHLASKVRMALFEIVPGYVISDVKFYDATSTTATANPEGTLIGNFNNSGTLTVYFPTTGTKHATEKDYNKAHVKFTASTTEGETGVLNFKKFGAVKYGNQAEGTIPEGATYLSQNAAKPSYCGADDYYQNVLPSEGAPSAITLRIDYKLTSVDGSNETINEASVANALVKGTPDATAKTWTVKDYAGKKMVVTETAANVATTVTSVPAGPGYTLNVNALKWTGVVTDPATETYYAVEYVNGTKKSYKIVKVVKN